MAHPTPDLRGEYPMPKFTNIAPQMGLDLLGWSGSVIMEDFEGRGLLDLMISSARPGASFAIFITTATALSPNAPKRPD